ncbi:uncharacterized protein [Mytilus edulis]|uniref:uncharacterized protein n=1 Tax=Mytilus edulis TaxID=6550 RepID=UPI0039EF4B87
MKPKQEPISFDQRKVWVLNVVFVLFPKLMRLLLQSFITPRGLLNKYNNSDMKFVLTEKEKSEMEKLPKMAEFTIELCYKILRFEKLVPKPSSQWEVPPEKDHQEITDDIKRIVFDTNDVLHKLGEDVSNTSYETFKGRVEEIVARIDSYLSIESCKHWYEEDIPLETDLDRCMTELQKMREIDFTSTTAPSLSDMEIENGERFARIGWVIIDIFPKILRAVIQMKIAADVMYKHCSTPPNWGRFSYDEQNKLKSMNSSNTYDLLDIPLVYRLLRQFSLIQEPANAWGQQPSSSHISTGDDIERIRFLRNDFAHRSNINTTQSEFDDTFSTFKDICRRMDVYFKNDRASGYENDVSRKETTPMDNQWRQNYQKSLQELENIKLRFVKTPVNFYWGEAVETSLKNLRQIFKDEKDKRKDVTEEKLCLQIVVQNIEDESAISRLIDEEFKDEINKGLISIKLKRVSIGSIILHVGILQEAVCSEETFQLTLVQFVDKVLQTGHLRLPTIGNVDIVLVQEDEYTTMQLFMQESAPQLCFDFEIERSDFETDMKLKATLGETVTTMLRHSNGTGHMSDVSATISTGSFGEISLAHPVFIKTETGEETPETGSDVKQNIHDSKSLTPAIKKDPGRLIKSDLQTNVADETDSTSFHRVKKETSDEEKYDEILVDVNNLKCLLKIKGLPNDIYQSEPEERPPYVKDTELLYVEWTLACPSKWNASLISSNIQDNPNAFHDEFSIEFVYNESSRLIIHTTAQRCVFRSYSSLEVAVKNLLANILNVSTIKSTEPAELSASALIMTKPEEESFQVKFNREWKTNQSISGLKDNIVTCDNCTQSFSCKSCTSKINHIRRQDKALKMKDQTIQRLEKALTKREKEAIEEDESDYDSYYSAEKNTINEEPRDYTRNSSTTREIEMSEEPEQKKRKTATTSEIENLEENQTEDGSISLNHLVVDMKQALQKLGEIPLLDNCIATYMKYMKKVNEKWIGRPLFQIRPKNEQAILNNLLKEKRKRTKLIAKLKVVIHNEDEFTTTDEGYGTDIRFLDVDQNPAIKCNNCQTKDDSHISCYCKDCQIFSCDNCVIEHRMKNKNHNYFYRPEILRGYKLADSWTQSTYSRIVDFKFMAADLVAILHIDNMCTYNLRGILINSLSITMDKENSRIACINACKIAVTVPSNNLIHILTIQASTTLTDLRTPEETKMTGGINCRINIIYVAFSDAIRLMDLSGQIQRVVNIPSVDILHSVNNDKMLCVYNKFDSVKTVSCFDFTNGSLYDFERFPFHPEDITTDDIGNIIFIKNGVIWLADSDGKNIKIIMSPEDARNAYEKITYNKDSKCLFTYHDGYFPDDSVNVYRKLE